MTKGLDTYTNIVYEIKNKVNGKRYIGITTNTFYEEDYKKYKENKALAI